jgi:hypothetical protein
MTSARGVEGGSYRWPMLAVVSLGVVALTLNWFDKVSYSLIVNRERFKAWLPYGRLTDALGLRVKKGIPALGGIRTAERHVDKIRRNGPCPCGSGKKFKNCHGAGGFRGALWKLEERLRGYDEST